MDSGTGIKSPHILLLEDDRAHQDLVLRAFRDDPEPFRVSIAGTIRGARQVIERDPPDLILADWILPDGKGLDILPRTDGKVTIPLIVMTSFGDEHLAVEIMKSGAIDYVVKSAAVFKDLPHISRRALRDWENIRERIRAEETAQEFQKRLADIIGFLPDAVIAIDNDGRVIAWNNAIERMTGVRAEDMLGKGDHEYSIPFYGERRPILVDLVLMDDSEIEKKYDYIRREGDRIASETFIPTLFGGKGAYLWGTASPLIDNAGNRTGAIEVIRDITERKRAEEALQAKEYQLSTIYRNVSEVLYFLSVEQNNRYRFLSVNRSFLDVTGLTQEQVVGKYVHEIIPEPSLTLVLGKYDQAIRNNTTITWEEISEYPAGKKYGEVSITPLIDATGRCTNLVGSVHDITERKRAEEILRESEEKYRFLIDNVRDIVWQTTPDLTFTYLSSAAETLTGYSPDELIGTSLYGILTEPSVRVVQQRLRERIDEYSHSIRDLATVFEAELTKKDGSPLWLEISSNAVFASDGTLVGFHGIGRDITERKRAEKALVDSEERFRDLFNNMSAGVAIYEKTPDGKDFIIRDVNRAVETIEQVKKEEIVGKSVLEVFPGVVEFGLFDVFKRVATTGTAESHPVTMYRDNRISGWRENFVYNLPSGDIVAIYEDVTEKKQAEERLRESEGKYHRLYDSMMDAFATVAMDGRITLFNEAFREMVGYEEGEIYNLTYNELTPDKWHAVETEIIEDQVLVRGYSEIYEKEYRRKDGTVFPVELRTFLIKDYAGNPQGMAAIVRNITERKLAEGRLRESEEKFRTLFENMQEGFAYCRMFYDSEGRPDDFMYLDVNAAFDHIVGTRAVIHKRVTEIFPGIKEESPEFFEIYGRVALTGNPETFDIYFGPSEKWLHISAFSPRKEYFVAAFEDITERKLAEDALRTSEEKFRTLFENMLEGFAYCQMIYDDEGRPADWVYLEVNRAFENLTELGNVTGKRVLEVIPDIRELTPELFDMYGRVASTGTPETFEIDFKPLKKWLRVSTFSPKPGYFVAAFEDITVRKLAEERLRSTETRFRALIQNSSDIIRIIDRNGWIVYESPSAERILGYPAGSLIGTNPMENIYPDDLERVKNDFHQVFDRTNTGTPTEFRIRKADGTYIWVDSIGINLLDVPGVNGIVVTTRPIQQRKEAEQALRENEARLATAMDIAGLVNWEFDVATGMFTFDDRFYALYGTTADQEGGNLMPAETYLQEFVYPDDRPYVLSEIRKILATTDPAYTGQMEHRITPRDGSVRTIIARYVPVMGPDGKVIRTIGANQDITDFKLMESEIRSLNTVLEQRVKDRTEALSKANEALEEEVAQRQEAEKKLHASYDEKVMLLKEIHHRVKNNLQIVASLLNLQSRYITDPRTLAAIRESQNRVKAMALVHERLYRTEDISHIGLHDYLRFLGTGLFQFYDAKTRGIKFTLEISDINVDIDAAIPLGLALNELISNSLKYAFPEGRTGEISISVKKEGRTLTVLYRDNGIGIPADLDWRNTLSLGLRLVNTLVDQMDGTVELDRSSGTLFTMVLHEKEQRGPS